MSAAIRALILSAALAGAALAAPITVTRPHFSLTFPDGWTENPYVHGGDSVVSLLNLNLSGAATLIGTVHSHPGDAAALLATMAAISAKSSKEDSSGTRRLGSHSFLMGDWHDTTAANKLGLHMRIYVLVEGGFTFIASLSYSPAKPSAITEFETALASLAVSAGAGVRPAAYDGYGGYGGAQRNAAAERRDALGRLPSGVTSMLPWTALFTRP